MAILPLSEATSRVLCSSQVLTTPASLVKELIDNALDAKATSINIIISANTLDKIEVRDNGHGIANEDLDSLGRRGYTSKLRKFEELRTIGGLSLGFRGEALASAVELGEVSIITRVEGEAVAVAIKLKANGGVESQSPTSHPVGTTVCVTNFFSRLPVRRQNALKETRKTLMRIKELLQSYALARLRTRLTLRVLKGGKSTWSFSPRPSDSIKEIVSQVVSRDVAAECVEKSSSVSLSAELEEDSQKVSGPISSSQRSPQRSQHSKFIFEAFLPKANADLSKVSGGHHVSIDSRPVSCARGTMKKIITIYKIFINAIAAEANLEKIENPFIRLNIICPVASYDPNVEPAKDNVLFEDESMLLLLMQDWFKSIYGNHDLREKSLSEPPAVQEKNREPLSSPASASIEAVPIGLDHLSLHLIDQIEVSSVNNEHFDVSDVLESPFPTTDIYADIMRSPPSSVTAHMLKASNTRIQLDMSEDSREYVESHANPSRVPGRIVSKVNAQEMPTIRLNPWVIAKISAPFHEKKAYGSTSSDTEGLSSSQRSLATPFKVPTIPGAFGYAPSPATQIFSLDAKYSPDGVVEADGLQGSLDNWLNGTRMTHTDRSKSSKPHVSPQGIHMDNIATFVHSDGESVSNDVTGSVTWPPPATQERTTQRHRAPDKPFMSQARAPEPIVSQIHPMSMGTAKSLPSRHPQSNETMSDMFLDSQPRSHFQESGPNSAVEEALDFEQRKEMATWKLREELRQARTRTGTHLESITSTISSSPHKNRHNAATAKLDTVQQILEKITDKMPAITCLPDGDPRAYLLRRQQSIAAYAEKSEMKPKLKRTKTMLLPLERIPTHSELHNLIQAATIDVNRMSNAILALADYDEYTTTGKHRMGLQIASRDLMNVEERVRIAVQRWTQVTTGELKDIEFDFGVLRGKSVINA